MDDSQSKSPSQFSLKSGEKITGCCLPSTSGSDRILEELAHCNHCLRPTYKVVVVTAGNGWERRAALCVSHFAAAVHAYPELQRQSA
jgi:hypothetical protein